MVSDKSNDLAGIAKVCLNPCFNGRWSLTPLYKGEEELTMFVLILVLMEDGL